MRTPKSENIRFRNTRRRYDLIVILIALSTVVYYWASDDGDGDEKETSSSMGLSHKDYAKSRSLESLSDANGINPFSGNTNAQPSSIDDRTSDAYTLDKKINENWESRALENQPYSDSDRYSDNGREVVNMAYGSSNNPYRYNSQGEILDEDCPPLYAGGNDYARARLKDLGCLPAQ